MQQVPKITNIPINAVGGALVLIAGTIMASKVEVMEDPAYNNGVQQGLTGFYMDPDSNHAAPAVNPSSPLQQIWLPNATGGYGRAFEPIIFGGSDGRVHGGEGLYTSAAGTPLLLLTSNGAAGGIILVEWS
jgi:hypothetical protein